MAKEKSRYIIQFPNPSYFKTKCSKEIVINFPIVFFDEDATQSIY